MSRSDRIFGWFGVIGLLVGASACQAFVLRDGTDAHWLAKVGVGACFIYAGGLAVYLYMKTKQP